MSRRGGYREGSGRKRLDGPRARPRVKLAISLPAKLGDWLEREAKRQAKDDGTQPNRSAVVAGLIREEMER